MIVKVEGCWSGHNRYNWRLSHPKFPRVIITTEGIGRWTRADAVNAKDSLARGWGVKRENIRFNHR